GGGFQSIAFAASLDGSVVVGFGSSFSGIEAFRWTAGSGMVGLSDLAGGLGRSTALGVSADGSLVVGQGTNAIGPEAIVWDATNGMRELDQVLAGLGVSTAGWTLYAASGVSADGQTIAGWGRNPSGSTEAWIAVIPEPSTDLLFGVGLVALAATQRRRMALGSAGS